MNLNPEDLKKFAQKLLDDTKKTGYRFIITKLLRIFDGSIGSKYPHFNRKPQINTTTKNIELLIEKKAIVDPLKTIRSIIAFFELLFHIGNADLKSKVYILFYMFLNQPYKFWDGKKSLIENLPNINKDPNNVNKYQITIPNVKKKDFIKFKLPEVIFTSLYKKDLTDNYLGISIKDHIENFGWFPFTYLFTGPRNNLKLRYFYFTHKKNQSDLSKNLSMFTSSFEVNKLLTYTGLNWNNFKKYKIINALFNDLDKDKYENLIEQAEVEIKGKKKKKKDLIGSKWFEPDKFFYIVDSVKDNPYIYSIIKNDIIATVTVFHKDDNFKTYTPIESIGELSNLEEETKISLKRILYLFKNIKNPSVIDSWSSKQLREFMKEGGDPKDFAQNKAKVEEALVFVKKQYDILRFKGFKFEDQPDIIYFDNYEYNQITIPKKIKQLKHFMRDSLEGMDENTLLEDLHKNGYIRTDYFKKNYSNNVALNHYNKMKALGIRDDIKPNGWSLRPLKGRTKYELAPFLENVFLVKLKNTIEYYLFGLWTENKFTTTNDRGKLSNKLKEREPKVGNKKFKLEKYIKLMGHDKILKELKKGNIVTINQAREFLSNEFDITKQNLIKYKNLIIPMTMDIPMAENVYAIFKTNMKPTDEIPDNRYFVFYLFEYNEMLEKMKSMVKALFRTKMILPYPDMFLPDTTYRFGENDLNIFQISQYFRFGVNYWTINPVKEEEFFSLLKNEDYVKMLMPETGFGKYIYNKLMRDYNSKYKLGVIRNNFKDIAPQEELNPYDDVKETIKTYKTLIEQWEILTGITGYEELDFVERLKLEKFEVSDEFKDFRMPKALKFMYFFNKWINHHKKGRNDILVHWDIIYEALIKINVPIDEYSQLFRGSELFNNLKLLEEKLKKYYDPELLEVEME